MIAWRLVRFWVFAILLAGPMTVRGEDVEFNALFGAAKLAPINGLIVVQPSAKDTLVIKGGSVSTDGLRLLISASNVRIDGDAEVRSFLPTSTALVKPGLGAQGSPGSNAPNADGNSHGDNGGLGGAGGEGSQGDPGADGPLFRINVLTFEGTGHLTISAVGQQGGKGQQGGSGGQGGAGGKGGEASEGPLSCKSSGADGGDGGRGGAGGSGGKGGTGGVGGRIFLSCAADKAKGSGQIVVAVAGGNGGLGGDAGQPGGGGLHGDGGSGKGFCGGGNGGTDGGGNGAGANGATGDGGQIGKVVTVGAC